MQARSAHRAPGWCSKSSTGRRAPYAPAAIALLDRLGALDGAARERLARARAIAGPQRRRTDRRRDSRPDAGRSNPQRFASVRVRRDRFLSPATDLRSGLLARHFAPRDRGDSDAADRAVSEHRAADGTGSADLHRRERRGRRGQRDDAARAGDQRRSRAALHLVAVDEPRRIADHRDVQPRPRPRLGDERRAERRQPRARAPTERGQAHRRHRFEEQRHVRHGHRRHVDQSGVDQRSHDELPRKQRHQRPAAHPGRQRRASLRRTQVRDAAVGRPEAARRQRLDGRRRDRGPRQPEHSGRGRRDRRAADERQPALRVHGALQRPAARSERASATSSCVRRPTAATCACATSAGSNSAPKTTRAASGTTASTPSVSVSCSSRPATRCKSRSRSSRR